MLTVIFLLIVLAVVGLAAIPLAMGVVPPNPYYGWPTGHSRLHPKEWLRVNLFAGRALVVAAIVAGTGLMFYNGTWLKSALVQLVFVIVILGIAICAIVAYARRFES